MPIEEYAFGLEQEIKTLKAALAAAEQRIANAAKASDHDAGVIADLGAKLEAAEQRAGWEPLPEGEYDSSPLGECGVGVVIHPPTRFADYFPDGPQPHQSVGIGALSRTVFFLSADYAICRRVAALRGGEAQP